MLVLCCLQNISKEVTIDVTGEVVRTDQFPCRIKFVVKFLVTFLHKINASFLGSDGWVN